MINDGIEARGEASTRSFIVENDQPVSDPERFAFLRLRETPEPILLKLS